MRHARVLCVLAALLVLAAGCGQAMPAVGTPAAGLPSNVALDSRMLDAEGDVPQVGEQAPDFSFTSQDGTQQRLSDLRGKVVLVNFWATWCAPCKEELPELQRISDEYGAAVTVLSINKLETLEAIAPFAEQTKLSFALVPNPSGDITDRYAAKNIPMTYFIGGDGTIGAVQLGVMTYEQAKAQIERLN